MLNSVRSNLFAITAITILLLSTTATAVTPQILSNYFDITANSGPGTFVSGRLNAKANKDFQTDASTLSDYEFILTSNGGGKFELVNQRDTVSRVFGALRTTGGTVDIGPDGLEYSLSAKLARISTGETIETASFVVHVKTTTILKTFGDRVKAWAVLDNDTYGRTTMTPSQAESTIDYIESNGGKLPSVSMYTSDADNLSQSTWLTVVKKLGGLGYALSEVEEPLGSDSLKTRTVNAIGDAFAALAPHILVNKDDMYSSSELAGLSYEFKDIMGDGFSDFNGNKFSHNQVTHQWEVTDPVTLPSIEIAEDLRGKIQSSDTAVALRAQKAFDGMLRLFSVQFAIVAHRRELGRHRSANRWGNLLDTQHSLGILSDANVGHRVRCWIGLAYAIQDYNQPLTYIPYYYDDFDFERFRYEAAVETVPTDFSMHKSLISPTGSISDLRDVLLSTFAGTKQYAQSGYLPDGFIVHHQDYCTDAAMLAYGFEWLGGAVDVAGMLRDTPFAMDKAWLNRVSHYLVYSYNRIQFRGMVDWAFLGREYHSTRLHRFYERHLLPKVKILVDDIGSGGSYGVPADIFAGLQLIKDNDGLSYFGDYPEFTATTAFWNSDSLVHRKSGWYTSLRMKSIRTQGNEDFQSSGGSWNMGGGFLQVRVAGDEYDTTRESYDYTAIPGVTEEWKDGSSVSKSTKGRCGGNTYSTTIADEEGGVGLGAFQYKPSADDQEKYSVVNANKAYFFVEDGVIAVGNSVERVFSGNGKSIITTIDQTKFRGTATYAASASVSESTIASGNFETATMIVNPGETGWIHQGEVGYLIHVPAGDIARNIIIKTWNGDEDDLFFCAIDHGTDPVVSTEKYIYMLLPKKTKSETKNAASSSGMLGSSASYDVPVNTEEAVALVDKRGTVGLRAQMVMIAFFAKNVDISLPFASGGLPATISSSELGSIIMRRQSGGGWWKITGAEGTKDGSINSMRVSISDTKVFMPREWNYILPGVFPLNSVDKVVTSEVGGKTLIDFAVPDDAAYDYAGKMYLGAPITVLVAEPGQVIPDTSSPSAAPTDAPTIFTSPSPTVVGATGPPSQSPSTSHPSRAPTTSPTISCDGLPLVNITSPVGRSNFAVNQVITVTATATDLDGAVSNVLFYAGDDDIGAASSSVNDVYSADWTPVASGIYSLRAFAVDNDGVVGVSKTIKVSVGTTLQTTAISNSDDSSIREGSPTSTANWGTVEIYGKAGSQIVGVFKFDISSYAGAEGVSSSKLRLYTTYVKNDGAVFSVYRATGDEWEEASVTWNNGPAKGTLVSNLRIENTGQYYEFDVTTYVAEKVEAGAGLITFWLEDSTLNNEKFEVSSRRSDQANPPKLEVTTGSAPELPDGEDDGGLTRCAVVVPPGWTASPTAAPSTVPPGWTASPTAAPSPTLGDEIDDVKDDEGKGIGVEVIAGIGGVTVGFILCFAAKVFFARNKSSVSKSSNVQELEPIDLPKGGSAIVVADGGLLQIGTQL